MPTSDERFAWLQRTLHVLCYDGGAWFCAWRGADGLGWTDRPSAATPTEAVDAAMAEVESENERPADA